MQLIYSFQGIETEWKSDHDNDMNKENVVQFVGFVTKLKPQEFTENWHQYSNQSKEQLRTTKLHEATGGKTTNRYSYLSQHFSDSAEFKFAFMKGKSSENFPERMAKVVLMGGYTAIQLELTRHERTNEQMLVVFLNGDETELDFYREQQYQYLNIYQAYYENCSYSYILEYFVAADDAEELINILKTRSHNELALFKECSLSYSTQRG